MFAPLIGILFILVLPLALPVVILAAVLSGLLVLMAALVHSCGGFPIGIAIGLLLYRMIRRRGAEKKTAACVEAHAKANAVENEAQAEPTMSRYNGTGCCY